MKTTAPLPPLRSVKVLDQLRERIRCLHYSLPPNRLMSTGFVAFIRFHGVRHPATLGSSESRHFCPGWRTGAGFGLRNRRNGGPCCSSGARGCTTQDPAAASGDRKASSAVLALAIDAARDETVSHPRFLEGEHRLFAQLYMERAYGSLKFACRSRIWISITARSSLRRKRTKGSGASVPEAGASLRERCRVRAWWLDRAGP